MSQHVHERVVLQLNPHDRVVVQGGHCRKWLREHGIERLPLRLHTLVDAAGPTTVKVGVHKDVS